MNKYKVHVQLVAHDDYTEEVEAETEKEALKKALSIGYQRDCIGNKPLIYAYDAKVELIKNPEAVIAATPPIQMFRKIGPLVRAIQWFPGMDVPKVNYKQGANPEAWLNRIYGRQPVNPGDWIVKGPGEKVNALPPEAFAEEYEEV